MENVFQMCKFTLAFSLSIMISCYRCEFSFSDNLMVYENKIKRYSRIEIPEAWILAT